MTRRLPLLRRHRTLALLALMAGSALVTPAFAQDAAPRRQVDGEKILQLLVAKGVISQSDADGIVAQATIEPAAPAVVAGGVSGDIQTIPYIPETVREQIKSELRQELAGQAEAQGWAKPGEVAEWTKRIRLYGDVRVREEALFFDKHNDPSIVNFNAINTGSPYNLNRAVAGSPNPPYLDTTENRNRARIRARIGLEAQLTDSIKVDVRAATGNDTSPVSTNQTLGGGNGDFSKYSIWLDRANIQFTPHGRLEGTKLVVGRAANPFWTTELIFDNDINFDGVSLSGRGDLSSRIGLFGTFGAFPTYNTDLAFGSRDVSAFKSHDRWLLAAQAGASFRISDTARFTLAAGYYHFTGMQGQISSPCLFSQDVCDTDNTRPLFQQYGNSVMPIRTIVPDTTVAPGLSPEPQYFGLASKFHVLEVHAALDLNSQGRIPVRIEGEFIDNLGFNRGFVMANQSNVVGPYAPSQVGWFATVMAGKPDPVKWGEWNVFGGYKRIGTDAMVDGFVDSDFHLGGTNAKGYILGGAFGIGGGTALGVRWLSADAITGQPYAVDVLQVDLTARF